ncbi:MAG: HlyD family efflux transporter periplasmic adaptor subunit [Pseudomonadota bacterium]
MYEEQQLAEERLSIWRQRLSLLGSTQGRNSEMLIALREREAQRAELVETNRAIRNHVIQIEQIAREIRATKITSPAAGTAVLETSMAPGTFIPTSKTVLEIIPDSDRFVFELEVKQRHLKHLQVGRQVSLTIDDNRSDTPEMTTEVVRVLPVADANGTAPDRLYLATLKPFEKSNEAGRFTHRGSAALQPGQFVSVQIQTGSGTLVEYLLAPFLRTFERSFTED